ncbi:MAG: inositol monophosphatase [Myxococcales bacterium]|nr:inositol monophosphatase [Myxococcales bacterium]
MPDHISQWEADLAVARQIAEGAGDIIKSYWGQDFSIEHKGVVDLVSEVDLAAEAYLLQQLAQRRPKDLIMAEESAHDSDYIQKHLQTDAARIWCIDPLDGTTNFSHGFPHFCVSIALLEGGLPKVGVIHDPIKAFTFYAIKGQGAYLNGKRLQVSQQEQLERALLATGFPYDRHTSEHDNVQQARAFLKRCQGLRRAGAAALDLAYVAAGWLDGYWEYKLKPWDIAAGALMVEEAGGIISDTDHRQDYLAQGTMVSAASQELHNAMLHCLRELS